MFFPTIVSSFLTPHALPRSLLTLARSLTCLLARLLARSLTCLLACLLSHALPQSLLADMYANATDEERRGLREAAIKGEEKRRAEREANASS